MFHYFSAPSPQEEIDTLLEVSEEELKQLDRDVKQFEAVCEQLEKEIEQLKQECDDRSLAEREQCLGQEWSEEERERARVKRELKRKIEEFERLKWKQALKWLRDDQKCLVSYIYMK